MTMKYARHAPWWLQLIGLIAGLILTRVVFMYDVPIGGGVAGVVAAVAAIAIGLAPVALVNWLYNHTGAK